MRVVHVATRSGLGGAESYAADLCRRLVRRHGVECAYLEVNGPTDADFARAFREGLRRDNVQVIEAPARLTSFRRSVAVAAFRLREAVTVFRPDIVHLHTEIPEAAWVAMSILPRGPVPTPAVFRTIHSAAIWSRWSLVGRFVERRLGGAIAVAVSQGAASAYRSWTKATTGAVIEPHVVPSGVEVNTVPVQRRAKPRPRPMLLFAGRLEPEKGVDVLVEALRQLDSTPRTFDMTIIGAGSLRSLVEQSCRTLARTVHVGPPRHDLRDHIGEFDAVVMPSRSEALGLLALETLARGVPLLASAAPGLTEALPPTYPTPSSRGDPESLAQQIERFVADSSPWTRSAGDARDWVRRHHDADATCDRYRELYVAALRPSDRT